MVPSTCPGVYNSAFLLRAKRINRLCQRCRKCSLAGIAMHCLVTLVDKQCNEGGEERNCFLHPLTHWFWCYVGADEQYWCLAKGEHWLPSSRSKAFRRKEWKEREKCCSLPLLHLNDLISVESPHLQLAVEVSHRKSHQLLVCDPTLKEVKLWNILKGHWSDVICNSYSCVANNEWAVCIQFHSTASLQAFPKTACQRVLGMGKGRVKGKRDLAKKRQHLVLWLWRVQTSWDLQEDGIILRKDRHDKDHCAKNLDDKREQRSGTGCCKAMGDRLRMLDENVTDWLNDT